MTSTSRYAALWFFLLGAFVACDSSDSVEPGPGVAGNAGAGGAVSGAGGQGGTATGTAGSESAGNAGSAGSGGNAAGAGNGGSAGGGAGGSGADGGSAGDAAPGGTGGTSNAGSGASAGTLSGSSGSSGSAGAGGVAPSEPITAVDAAAAMGKGVNLGQMFENVQHPPTLAAAAPKIDAYYDRGFRLLRIPVTWTEHAQGDLLVNDAAVGDVDRAHPRLSALLEVVDYALAKPDLYVVVNAHHEKTLKTEGRATVLERLWADIADIFAERDYRLIFEILNEPHRNDDSAMPPETLRDMTGKAYSKIRAADAGRLVVIGGNQWFAAAEMAQTWPNLDAVGGGNDPYVMATFHHYDPWTFCGDNQGTYDDAWTEANLADPMDTMLAWSESVGNGMPIFIGEWGVGWGSRYDVMECNNVRLWYEGMHEDHAAPRGMPTAVWDDGGWFKIYDHATNGYANNLVDCIAGDCEWTGTERFNSGCE